MRKAITDPRHPWHKGAQLLDDLEKYDERGRAFMRKIGPYCFEADGSVLKAKR